MPAPDTSACSARIDQTQLNKINDIIFNYHVIVTCACLSTITRVLVMANRCRPTAFSAVHGAGVQRGSGGRKSQVPLQTIAEFVDGDESNHCRSPIHAPTQPGDGSQEHPKRGSVTRSLRFGSDRYSNRTANRRRHCMLGSDAGLGPSPAERVFGPPAGGRHCRGAA